MGMFSALLVEALGGVADAGLKSYAHSQTPVAAGAGGGGGKKKKRTCSSCEALREVERAKARISKGKL